MRKVFPIYDVIMDCLKYVIVMHMYISRAHMFMLSSGSTLEYIRCINVDGEQTA